MTNKYITKFLFIVFILSIGINLSIITKNLHHECTNEDCKVCTLLRQTKKNLEDYRFDQSQQIILIVCLIVPIYIIFYIESIYNKKLTTLVGKKVRLDI